MHAPDLFDVDDAQSIVRQIIQANGQIRISDFPVPSLEVPQDYVRLAASFSREGYAREIGSFCNGITRPAVEQGFPMSLETALNEAVRNAHQHGNGYDPNKRVHVAYRLTPEDVRYLVEDEGGVLTPEFLPYVLRHREKRHAQRPVDFYTFSGKPQNPANLGTGTMFMHLYSDAVQYFKSPNGGLIVSMFTRKPTDH